MKTTITKFSVALIGLFLLAGTTFTAKAQAVGDKFKDGSLYYKITNLSPSEVEATSQLDYPTCWNDADKPTGAVAIPASVPNGGKTYTVTGIGDYAFAGCSGLTSVTIPASVTSIGDFAFYNCRGLTSVTIPAGVTSIGNGVFFYCRGLTSVTIPASVTSIGKYAFSYCSGLTSVTIPAGVTSIGDYTFFDCSGLTSVTISAGVTSIGKSAFDGCSGLTSVTIPAGVTSIGEGTFYGCIGLTAITVTAGNTAYSSVDGVLFNYAKSTLIQYPPAKSGTVYSIPTSVTDISFGAFYGCRGLTSVTISAGVTSIGKSAFSDCRGLTSITISASVTSIGEGTFYGCIGLTAITVTAGNTAYSSVDGVLFNYAKSTLIQYPPAKSGTVYSIPTSVTDISFGAFYGCSGLTSVTIPAGVTSIDNKAFSACSGLTQITCAVADPAAITMGNGVFYAVPKTIPLNVPIGSKPKYAAADQWKDFTNIVEKVFTGVPATLSGQGIRVWGGKGVIYIDTHGVVETHGRASLRNTVQVYDLSGQLVHSSLLPLQGVGGQVSVPAGIYIVQIGSGAEKVMVR